MTESYYTNPFIDLCLCYVNVVLSMCGLRIVLITSHYELSDLRLYSNGLDSRVKEIDTLGPVQ